MKKSSVIETPNQIPGQSAKKPTLFQTKMVKIDTLFQTKTAQKQYPLAPHIPL